MYASKEWVKSLLKKAKDQGKFAGEGSVITIYFSESFANKEVTITTNNTSFSKTVPESAPYGIEFTTLDIGDIIVECNRSKNIFNIQYYSKYNFD